MLEHAFVFAPSFHDDAIIYLISKLNAGLANS